MTTVRLVDDSGNTLLALNEGSFAQPMLRKLDLGYPIVRDSSTALSGQDGTYDVTQLVGARAVTAELLLTYDAPDYWVDLIRGLMHPGRRYWLHAQMDTWPTERRVRVRPASLTIPLGPLPWDAQLGWSAPSPMLQDTVASSVTLNPTGQPGGGLTFPQAFPVAFQPSLVPGASVLSVGGTVNAAMTVDIYGPCSGPLFRVVDTGCQLDFPTLSLAAGDYLHIDTAARTITLNNDPNQSQYDRLDFASSAWPSLPPGSPQVVFSPDSSSSGCVAVVSWRSSWL